MPSYVLGYNAKLKYGVAGATATTEMSNVKDVTLNLSTAEADVTTRATNGWRATAATLKEASVEFEILYDPSDAGFTALQNAYFGATPVALLVADAAGSGLDADFVITAFTVNQNLEEAVTVSVTAKPTSGTRAPQWKTAAS